MNRGAKIAITALACFVGLWIVAEIGGRALSPWAKREMISALEKKFKSKAEVQDLQVRLFPWFSAEATGLVFRHHGRTDVPPLIQIKRLSARSNPVSALLRRVSEVKLEGLEIRVARKKEEGQAEGQIGQTDEPKAENKKDSGGGFLVERIVADGTHLEILPKNPEKDPMVFDLKELTLFDAGPKSPMTYVATLTNPKPPGEIDTKGTFGPWNGDDPGQTPLDGDYVFTDADLSHFKGIAGILSSEGSFDGVLERIAVEGWTDTPDFSVSSSKQPVHLKTEFSAIVDGTSGDTYLQPVIARFEESEVYAEGKVAQEEGLKGKSVILDVRVDKGRVEDMLKLAVPAKDAVLEGPIQYTAKFRLPPGDQEVPARLELLGKFGMEDAEFTKSKVRKKLGELSNKAQGEPEAPTTPVESDLAGRFQLGSGVLSLMDLKFQIPGADVTMGGDYGLLTKELDFRGRIEMDAKISEATTGKKSFFLKLVDPFFKNKRKGYGSSIPIKVTGSVDDPQVGLALSGEPKS
ncbi:MAG: AsmA-like C-terminal region-containing protein [Bryobacterales bacterium]